MPPTLKQTQSDPGTRTVKPGHGSNDTMAFCLDNTSLYTVYVWNISINIFNDINTRCTTDYDSIHVYRSMYIRDLYHRFTVYGIHVSLIERLAIIRAAHSLATASFLHLCFSTSQVLVLLSTAVDKA